MEDCEVKLRRDRLKGAIVGTIIGDALALGPHWYYSAEDLRAAFGDWIDTYKAPLPGRYHEGLKAGDVSQTGQMVQLLLRSLADVGSYDEGNFTGSLDELLSTLDGTPVSGRYTDQAIRDVWKARKSCGANWAQSGSYADTAEAAIRAVVLAARYSADLKQMTQFATSNIKLTHVDPVVVGQSLAFAIVVAVLIRGESLDGGLATRLREMVKRQELPFTHVVLAEERGVQGQPQEPLPPSKDLPFVDALLLPSCVARAATDPEVSIPPSKVALVYGEACSIHFQLPAAYFLTASFQGRPDHFEQAVLHAVNSTGNNMVRAALTGALAGAAVGLSGIPARFVEGLRDSAEVMAWAEKVARDAYP